MGGWQVTKRLPDFYTCTMKSTEVQTLGAHYRARIYRRRREMVQSSSESALRRRGERDRERHARESPEERGARLSLRRVRGRQRARERRAVQRKVRLVSRRIRDRCRQSWLK